MNIQKTRYRLLLFSIFYRCSSTCFTTFHVPFATADWLLPGSARRGRKSVAYLKVPWKVSNWINHSRLNDRLGLSTVPFSSFDYSCRGRRRDAGKCCGGGCGIKCLWWLFWKLANLCDKRGHKLFTGWDFIFILLVLHLIGQKWSGPFEGCCAGCVLVRGLL